MTATFNFDLPSLSPDKVYLFYADTKGLEKCDINVFKQYLSQTELSRVDAFYFEKDRQLYLISHCLLRWVLSHYLQLPPEDIEFESNQFGKPFLKGNYAIDFNLSHSGGVAVLAISQQANLGIDIESIDESKELHSILDNYFHPFEVAQFKALDRSQQSTLFFKLFYKLWTLKEAFIKAKGLGLSMPLDAFYFDLSSPPTLKVFFAEELAEQASRWQFSLLSSNQYCGFITALAVQPKQASSHDISIQTYNIKLSTREISRHDQQVILQTDTGKVNPDPVEY